MTQVTEKNRVAGGSANMTFVVHHCRKASKAREREKKKGEVKTIERVNALACRRSLQRTSVGELAAIDRLAINMVDDDDDKNHIQQVEIE